MIITKLVQSKKIQLVQVFADAEYLASITKDTLIAFGIYKDKELSAEEWEKVLESDIVQRLYFQAIKQILARPRSQREVEQYLVKKLKLRLTDEVKIACLQRQILDKLISAKYIDDQAFARWWIENRTAFKGKSTNELQQELYQKGIDNDIIKELLYAPASEVDQLEIIKKITYKKFKITELPDDKKEQQRVLTYLLRRGFNYELIKSALAAADF
jgi:regulatory protein